jgi:hypothetical protein
MTRETATGYDGMRFSRLMPLSSRRAGERAAAKRDSGHGNLAAPPILRGQGPGPRSQVAQSHHPHGRNEKTAMDHDPLRTAESPDSDAPNAEGR